MSLLFLVKESEGPEVGFVGLVGGVGVNPVLGYRPAIGPDLLILNGAVSCFPPEPDLKILVAKGGSGPVRDLIPVVGGLGDDPE